MADPFLINGNGGAQDRLGVIAEEQIWEVDDAATCISHQPKSDFNIPILDRQWRQQAHGQWHVTIKFEGVSDVASADGKEVYDGDSGDSEDAIETFPGIWTLVNKYPPAANSPTPDGRILWSQTMDDGSGNQVPNPMFGVDSYKVSMPTWTQRKLYASLPNELYANIDKIFTTPPGNPPPPPTDSDGVQRNWLLVRVVPRQRGNIWEVASTWQMSGPGGCNPDIYASSGQ